MLSLEDFILENPKVALAFSGGCDSAFLLAKLLDLGAEVKAYTLDTAFQARFEIEDARRVAVELGASHDILRADILSQPGICANTPERCYLCKRFLFSLIRERMEQEGFEVLVDGTNADDDPARRPGFKALRELGVLSPLRLAGMGKDAIREESHAMGLSTADKPRFSCLATKLPPGATISREALDEAWLDTVSGANTISGADTASGVIPRTT